MKYIRDLLTKTRMSDAKPMPTPMIPSLYKLVVGSLQYAIFTRPDIAWAVNKVAQFMHNPLESHWKVVKRILRHLGGTLCHGLQFHPIDEFRLLAFCDSNWESWFGWQKVHSGFCIYLGPNLISWSSRKHQAVSRSSTEAKYRRMVSALAELIWLQSLLLELHITCSSPSVIFYDNQGAVLLATKPVLHIKSKHFELVLYFMHD